MLIPNIAKIMLRIIPRNPVEETITEDAKETMQECVSRFISFVTNEANKKCHRESRVTVTPEDLLCAMATLGFREYVEPLTLYLDKYRLSRDHPNSYERVNNADADQHHQSQQQQRQQQQHHQHESSDRPCLDVARICDEISGGRDYIREFLMSDKGRAEGLSNGFEYDPSMLDES